MWVKVAKFIWITKVGVTYLNSIALPFQHHPKSFWSAPLHMNVYMKRSRSETLDLGRCFFNYNGMERNGRKCVYNLFKTNRNLSTISMGLVVKL